MPIQITCPGCQAKLRAPDTAAGKKTKCPKCQTIVSVPANAASVAATVSTGAPAVSAAAAKADQWFLKTPDGSQYGPVPRSELDQWYSEGRISAECQLLKEGQTQWQWAADQYPALAQMARALAGVAGSSPGSLGAAAAFSSPLAPLSLSSSPADPLGLSPLVTSDFSPPGTSPNSSAATLPSFTSGTAPTTSPFGSPHGPSPNSYSTPAMGGTYGGHRPSVGHHPMVIVAGIFHILMGCWNAFNCFIGSIGAVALMAIGGAVGAAGSAGAGNSNPETEGLTSMIAAFGVLGGVIALIIALLFLAYGIFQIVTAVGLFMRRQWARTATFAFAGIGIAAMLLYVCLIIFFFDISSMIGLMGEIVYVPILLLAMLLPDSNRGFQ